MQRVLWIALAAAACGHPAPGPMPPPGASHATTPTPPPPPGPAPLPDAGGPLPLDHDMPRLAQRSLLLYQDVVAALAGPADDCPGATQKLRTLEQTHAEVIVAVAVVLHDGRAKDLRAALEGQSAALELAARTIADSPTLKRCAGDRAFADAFDGLVGSPP